jgi:hypothetical protein
VVVLQYLVQTLQIVKQVQVQTQYFQQLHLQVEVEVEVVQVHIQVEEMEVQVGEVMLMVIHPLLVTWQQVVETHHQ